MCLAIPKGFKAARHAAIAALLSNKYAAEARNGIDIKNLLAMGEVTNVFVAGLLRQSDGSQHRASPHHTVESVEVHEIKTQGWYIKFYFLDADPDTIFISVHQ